MLTQYSVITREERYFTSYLYHDIENNPVPFEKLLSKLLGKPIKIKESVYEAAFMRDILFYNPKKNELREYINQKYQKLKAFEKTTFDLLLILENYDLIIIEAKAVCHFSNEQLLQNLKIMEFIKEKYVDLGFNREPSINQIGLCSNRYTPLKIDKELFTTLIRWNEVASIYPKHKTIYQRACSIFNDRKLETKTTCPCDQANSLCQ